MTLLSNKLIVVMSDFFAYLLTEQSFLLPLTVYLIIYESALVGLNAANIMRCVGLCPGGISLGCLEIILFVPYLGKPFSIIV